jgi:hypothetical protein
LKAIGCSDPVFLSLADEVIDDIERGVLREIDHAPPLWLPIPPAYRKPEARSPLPEAEHVACLRNSGKS